MKPWLVFLSFFLCVSALPDSIDELYESIAESRAQRFKDDLGGPPGMWISVKLQDSLAHFYGDGVIEPHLLAVVSIAPDFFGCRVRMRKSAARDEIVIAHEVCHCILHWEDMNQYGWKPGTTPEMWKEKEREAQECAKDLVAGRARPRTGWTEPPYAPAPRVKKRRRA